MPTNKEIDLLLDEISKKVSFFSINPINEKEEKRKFFRSNRYNPQFKYEIYQENIPQLQEQLSEICPDNTVFGQLLKQTRNIYYANLNMLKNRGNEKFTKYSILCYGVPDDVLVEKANEMIKKLKPQKLQKGQHKEKKTLNTTQVMKKIDYAFIKYGFKWNIKEKEMAANAAVNVSRKELLLRKNTRFSEKFLKRLIVHEVGTHIVRAENGEHQPYKLFARGLPNYLMTEEGLAVVNEEMNGCLDNTTLKNYAARVIAVDISLKCSFRETYNYLRNYLDKELAWRTTLRAKRGLTDTSKPGGCTKDFAYLRGYFAVKNFIKEGHDLNKLYYGKIGLQHVEFINKIPELIDPEFLPTFRYLKYATEHFGSLLKTIFFNIPTIKVIKVIGENVDNFSTTILLNGNSKR